MSSLNQIIDYTKLFQDVELATAVGQLKQNPAQLQQFLQEQQGKVYNDVTKQKDSTFQKVYGDLTRASQAQDAVVKLDTRNKEFDKLHSQVYNSQIGEANAIVEDKNLANRKYEMNQWSIGNKNDTLFVFSFLFIILSALILLVVMWRMGVISGALCGSIIAPLIIIFILMVINRTQYTNIWRNKRYWNRKDFGGRYGKVPVPMCPGAMAGLDAAESSIEGDISSAGQALSNAEQSVASEMQNISNDVSSDMQSISSSIQNYSSQ
jgi:hypothetical protein